jgi:hypothetical protein
MAEEEDVMADDERRAYDAEMASRPERACVGCGHIIARCIRLNVAETYCPWCNRVEQIAVLVEL